MINSSIFYCGWNLCHWCIDCHSYWLLRSTDVFWQSVILHAWHRALIRVISTWFHLQSLHMNISSKPASYFLHWSHDAHDTCTLIDIEQVIRLWAASIILWMYPIKIDQHYKSIWIDQFMIIKLKLNYLQLTRSHLHFANLAQRCTGREIIWRQFFEGWVVGVWSLKFSLQTRVEVILSTQTVSAHWNTQ